ncbi:hypothetical protein ACFHPP_26760 [Falsiroseomonas sp. E2-1-a20]
MLRQDATGAGAGDEAATLDWWSYHVNKSINAEEHPLPANFDDPAQDPQQSRRTEVNPIAELLGVLSPEARRLLRNVAEETAQAALRAAGGPNPLAAAASTAARLLSQAARRPMETNTATDRTTRSQTVDRSVPTTSPLVPAVEPFVRLPQPGTDWSQFVRREAVIAIKSPSVDLCVVVLSDGRDLEVGGSSDAVARQIPGLVRLTQPGTQRSMYVRSSAVLAVTAPSSGCVLHLSNGLDLAAGEAAVVAANLIAGTG